MVSCHLGVTMKIFELNPNTKIKVKLVEDEEAVDLVYYGIEGNVAYCEFMNGDPTMLSLRTEVEII
jgi:hypothetical protein